MICCYQKKQLKSDQEHKNEIICKDIQRIEDNVDHLGHSNDEAYKSRVRSDIQKQLKELEKYVCPATVVSDGPDDTLQVDLDYINQSLGGILNKLQKSEKPSEDSHHYMAMLTIT